MHQSAKEKKILNPVNRELQLDYRASLEASAMLDEHIASGTPDRPQDKERPRGSLF